MQRIILTITGILCIAILSAAAEPRSWRQIAEEAIADGDHVKAAEYYAKWTEADPTDAVSLYNLACCHSLLGKPEASLEALTRARDAGWSDSAHTANDPDLESLRARDAFQKLLSDIARNARTRYGGYTVHPAAQTRTGQYVVVLPDNFDPAARYPLVVLLHGYGSNPEDFAATSRLISTTDYIYIVPEGPYAVLEAPGRAFSHLRERADFGEDEQSAAAAAEWVINAADDVLRRYPVRSEKFWVVGFSQGGALAHITAANYPDRVAGYCAHGGYLIRNTFTAEQLAAEQQAGVNVLLTHGRDDPAVGLDEAVYAFNMLKQAGVAVTLEMLDSPHRFTAEAGLKVGAWLREQAKP